MRKIYTLFSAIALCTVSAFATTFTFSSGTLSQTIEGITVTLARGNGQNDPSNQNNNGEMRLYASNTITVAGADLEKISLTFAKQGNKDYISTLSASTGNMVSGGISTGNTDFVTDIWTGSTNSVTFTLGDKGQRILEQIVVNGNGSDGEIPSNPGTPSTPDVPSTLDPNFVYMEPTLVVGPETTVQGDSYSFIANNVLVSCSKGAITDSYFSAHAGFEMTFTASKPIKGLVIDGFVKANFSAETDHGTISYLSPGDDKAANPVVVITDINSTSVTISCVKQLRCYSVDLYFDANPQATVSGGSSGAGETEDLTFDTAEAVYESEYSEYMEEENYSIYLYNWEDPEYVYFALDLYPASKNDLTGTYSWNDYSLGDFSYYQYGPYEEDFTWVDDGEVTITKSGDIYTITGWVYCDNDVTYNLSFSGEMPIYTDDEYYGDESGVKEVEAAVEEKNAPAYDLSGRRVGEGYRGIMIRNGRKVLELR